jgi:hypothetical protein
MVEPLTGHTCRRGRLRGTARKEKAPWRLLNSKGPLLKAIVRCACLRMIKEGDRPRFRGRTPRLIMMC